MYVVHARSQGYPASAPAPDDGGMTLTPHQFNRQMFALAFAACVQYVDAGFTYTRNPVAVAEYMGLTPPASAEQPLPMRLPHDVSDSDEKE